MFFSDTLLNISELRNKERKDVSPPPPAKTGISCFVRLSAKTGQNVSS